MKKILTNVSYLISKRQKLMMFFSFILVILVTFLETVSLGSIAGFVYFISDPDVLIDKIPQNFDFLKVLLKSKTQIEIIVYLSAILVLFFLIKNLFILGYHYFIGYLKKLINEKRVMYDHNIDQRGYKWSGKSILKKTDLNDLPEHVIKNVSEYQNWLD